MECCGNTGQADRTADANMTGGKRIAANAVVTYARSLVALVLGLFSARWVLAALGDVDFGLYAVVGSMMSFMGFFGSVLCVSVARHYAFSVGGGDRKDLEAWCAAACRIHIVLALGLTIIAWPLGEWCVRHVLVMPPERLGACLWTFYLGLVTLFTTVLAVPFYAMYLAYQRFGILAIFGLAQTLIMFCGAWWLLNAPVDRLIAYAGYMTLAFGGTPIVVIAIALVEFPVCRRPFAAVDMSRVKSLLSFAGWTVFGIGGWIVGTQGGAFVTNRFFGAAANAAYGLSQQVQYHTEALANALVGAFEPAVTAHEGAGERTMTVRLACRAGLFGALLLAVFALPLTLELPTVLALWLEKPPAGAALVCSIMLGAAVLNKLTMGQQLALNACGRIAGWQVSVGLGQVGALPLVAVIAWCGGKLESAAVAYAAAMVFCAAMNVWFGRRNADLGAGIWLYKVVVPFTAVTTLAALAGLLPRFLSMEAGFFRVCATSFATSLVFMGAAGAWWLLYRRRR